MEQQTVAGWLEQLASGAPTPGGGAAAATNAAVGAALISMVCNLTIVRPRYAEHEQLMREALAEAERARAIALRLADEDAEAFDAVIAAYRQSADTVAERQARAEAIQSALRRAADVPLRIADVAVEVIALATRILDGANGNVLSDVAVAALSARSALDGAAMNVLINLRSLDPGEHRDALAQALAHREQSGAEADAVVRAVRDRLGG